MPELKHEVPSRDELIAYLDEHFRSSMLWAFDMPAALGAEAFAKLAYDKLLGALLRLNELPRTDPLWHNTNHRPTFYKLVGFGRLLLDRDETDASAWWIFAILPCWTAQNHFGQEAWLELHKLGGLDPRWPICAAWVTDVLAHSADGQLAAYVRESGTVEESAAILRGVAEPNEKAAAWARRVLQVLGMY
jgi:hypothetical protein